jgi:preprotein translocase subunit SecY
MKSPGVLAHLPWRIAGLALLGGLVVAYHPEQGGVLQRLLIPVAMAVATWMLVQNLAAVALGAGILAGLHSAPASADWVPALAYPALAALCAVVLAVVFAQRFRRRIAATHEDRWRPRRTRQRSDEA